MKRYLSVLAILLVVSSMAGCAPPTKNGSTAKYGCHLPKDGGKTILPVNPAARGPFKTVVVDGAELIQARGPIGDFGGSFQDIQIGDGPKTFNPWASSDATSTMMGSMMWVMPMMTPVVL